jgi:hypothetical protein
MFTSGSFWKKGAKAPRPEPWLLISSVWRPQVLSIGGSRPAFDECFGLGSTRLRWRIFQANCLIRQAAPKPRPNPCRPSLMRRPSPGQRPRQPVLTITSGSHQNETARLPMPRAELVDVPVEPQLYQPQGDLFLRPDGNATWRCPAMPSRRLKVLQRSSGARGRVP